LNSLGFKDAVAGLDRAGDRVFFCFSGLGGAGKLKQDANTLPAYAETAKSVQVVQVENPISSISFDRAAAALPIGGCFFSCSPRLSSRRFAHRWPPFFSPQLKPWEMPTRTCLPSRRGCQPG
jgi:hypothetical protein